MGVVASCCSTRERSPELASRLSKFNGTYVFQMKNSGDNPFLMLGKGVEIYTNEYRVELIWNPETQEWTLKDDEDRKSQSPLAPRGTFWQKGTEGSPPMERWISARDFPQPNIKVEGGPDRGPLREQPEWSLRIADWKGTGRKVFMSGITVYIETAAGSGEYININDRDKSLDPGDSAGNL